MTETTFKYEIVWLPPMWARRGHYTFWIQTPNPSDMAIAYDLTRAEAEALCKLLNAGEQHGNN